MWNDLSMAERAKYIKLGVQSGITNLNTIRRSYNSFARGGYTKLEEDTKDKKFLENEYLQLKTKISKIAQMNWWKRIVFIFKGVSDGV